MAITDATADQILHFWFERLSYDDWFTRSDDLDRKIADRFTATHLELSRQRPQA